MRNSGFHLNYHWRVFPNRGKFTLRIDGELMGELKASTMTEAIKEAKAMIEELLIERIKAASL